ncbi:MAG: ABC transporter substrate-binding protein [Tumebacillaceae bacterium]
MRLLEDFIRLGKGFPHAEPEEKLATTIPVIADLLTYTPRYAKVLLTKMCDRGWIEFTPGRGRGHHSTLTFRTTAAALLLAEAQQRFAAGAMEEAFAVLQLRAEDHELQGAFLRWLSEHFGYQAEDGGERALEILRFPVFRPIVTLDPGRAFYSFDLHLVRQMFDTLVVRERSGRIRGHLAHHWEHNAERTKWVFQLRKGVLFHQGRELTAEVAVASLHRLRGLPQGWLMQSVVRVSALDRYAILFELSEPNHLLPRLLSMPPASIVWEEEDKLTGTGPFQLQKRTAGQCVLEAFPAYFQGRAHLDRVEIVRLPRDWQIETEQILVQNGEFLGDTREDWQRQEEQFEGCCILTLNQAKPGPLRQAALRKAMSLVLDRKRMVEELGEPRLALARGFFRRAEMEGYEPALARQLLDEVGRLEEPLRLHAYARHERDAHWIAAQLQAHGIPVEVRLLEWDEIQQPERLREADMILFEAVLSQGVVSLMELYQFEHSFVRVHLDEETRRQSDRVVQACLREPDEQERMRVLETLEEKLREEQALLFLLHKKIGISFSRMIRGIKVSPYGWMEFKDIWFDSNGVQLALQDTN